MLQTVKLLDGFKPSMHSTVYIVLRMFFLFVKNKVLKIKRKNCRLLLEATVF